MAYRVHKSDSGNIIVRSKEDNFTACYKDGKWTDRIVFNGDELEDMLKVNDPEEAEKFFNIAKKALQNKVVA
ncbi:MAG: hypothetical protein KGS72_21600 [Cyanobacteria bacterium REEB67]|nr:hypothetical protein [Cyanobacteria bacterium REEB67]